MSLRLLTADVVYTGMGLPQRDAGVVVSDGIVAATGRLEPLRASFPHAAETHVGAVISPRPINAHTHLDMSAYPFRALPYFRWIPEHVMRHAALRGVEGARRGLELVRASGAAALGDIVWKPGVMELLLQESDVPGVAYVEVLDYNPATLDDTFRRTVARVAELRRLERPGGMRIGLSPHASYTVHATLMRRLAEFARLEGLPMQIHVAEHPAELELFRTGAGPLADAFLGSVRGALGLDFADLYGRKPDSALTPVVHLADLGVLDAKPTLIHMVNVTEDDVRIVAQAGCAVVTCPRSNRNLECGTFPWSLYARHGVDVALGTDSVASGETLDIFDEIKAARHAHPDLDDRVLVRAAVKGGARVVGTTVPFLRRGEAWHDAYVWRT